MRASQTKKIQRRKRQDRIRAKVFGTSSKPRLSVYKSNKFTYAQIVDDKNGKTLVSANNMKMNKKGKLISAGEVGKIVAEKAIENKIKEVVFDRGGYIYTGRIRALAEAAREAGLKF